MANATAGLTKNFESKSHFCDFREITNKIERSSVYAIKKRPQIAAGVWRFGLFQREKLQFGGKQNLFATIEGTVKDANSSIAWQNSER